MGGLIGCFVNLVLVLVIAVFLIKALPIIVWLLIFLIAAFIAILRRL